jgi:hypothetical protein
LAQLDQIQITFVPNEDRMLLRLSTQSSEEFRFWLTRRLIKGLRPLITQSLAAQPRIQTQATAEAKRELLKFEHEQVMQAADFKTPYRASEKQLPLGEHPILISRIQVTRQPGSIGLSLAPATGQGINLALTPPLLHSFVALLDHALAAAEWDLGKSIPATTSNSGPVSIN